LQPLFLSPFSLIFSFFLFSFLCYFFSVTVPHHLASSLFENPSYRNSLYSQLSTKLQKWLVEPYLLFLFYEIPWISSIFSSPSHHALSWPQSESLDLQLLFCFSFYFQFYFLFFVILAISISFASFSREGPFFFYAPNSCEHFYLISSFPLSRRLSFHKIRFPTSARLSRCSMLTSKAN
jgi:hypothetical protein